MTRTRLGLQQIHARDQRFAHLSSEIQNVHDRVSFLDELGDYDVTYEYDENGNIQQETVYDTVTPVPNILKASVYTYNLDGTLNTETVTKEGMTVTKTFQYDSLGNLTGASIRKNP